MRWMHPLNWAAHFGIGDHTVGGCFNLEVVITGSDWLLFPAFWANFRSGSIPREQYKAIFHSRWSTYVKVPSSDRMFKTHIIFPTKIKLKFSMLLCKAIHSKQRSHDLSNGAFSRKRFCCCRYTSKVSVKDLHQVSSVPKWVLNISISLFSAAL